MTADLWTRLADFIPEALDLPHDAREAFLDTACRDATGAPDTVLRDKAEALLRASDAVDATDRFVSPLAGLPSGIASGVADAEQIEGRPLPRRIGAWTITGLLGEGGQGTVYRAARADGAFDREVALKLLRGATPARRLDAERRVLARLEHDGIARLYDGGTLDDGGAPYLVMELVDGRPLTEAAAALSLDDRVALVLQVCDAVAYAHRNLVVHRDLKPSNVLVTADGRVKLLDFGIAHLLDADGGLTRTGDAALTPAYSAPEQLLRQPVTTATDGYTLGVLLYEVLAGRRPYDLSALTAGQAERVVCHETPPPPSAAAGRAIGDLDTVVLKALEKDAARRYGSVEALADDLQRWRDGFPVRARPATTRYRTARFVRRHRAALAAAALALAAVLGGAGTALWQAREARAEAAKATATQDFVLGMIDAANPDVDGRDVRVADLLDRASATLDSTLADQPDVRADARARLGWTYYGLGLLDEADAELRRAVALATARFGPDDLRTAEAQSNLATVRRDLADYETADSLYALALATVRRRAGPADPRTAQVLAEIGTLRFQTGDFAAAVDAYRETLAIERATLPAGHIEILISMQNLAVALSKSGDTEGAISLLEQVVAVHREGELPGDNLPNALANLAVSYAGAERFDDAERAQREAVGLFRSILGDGHPSTVTNLSNLGSTLVSLGRPAEAEPLLRESIATTRATLGPEHPTVGFPLVNLAKALRDLDRLDEANDAVDRADRLFRDGYGADHWTEERITETRASIRTRRRVR